MANLFFRLNFNRVFFSIVLTTFTLTYAIPLPAVQVAIGLNEVAFMLRLEKAVEKLMKLEKKGSLDDIISALLDIKSEIETSCNTKLNINSFLDYVEQEIKKSGYNIPKKEFTAIRKKFKKQEKKHKHHADYIAMTMYNENYAFNIQDELELFEAKHGKDKDDKDDDKEEVFIPAQLVFGVSMTLCGLFLMVVPFPACKVWGERMVASGVIICGNCISGELDKKNKDKD